MFALLVSLIVFSTGVDAQKPRRTGPHESRTQARLLKRCQSGVGKACFDYGHNLELLEGKSKRRESIAYIRMACNLAYARACGRMSPPEKLKLHYTKTAKTKKTKSTKISQKSARPVRSTASVAKSTAAIKSKAAAKLNPAAKSKPATKPRRQRPIRIQFTKAKSQPASRLTGSSHRKTVP